MPFQAHADEIILPFWTAGIISVLQHVSMYIMLFRKVGIICLLSWLILVLISLISYIFSHVKAWSHTSL